MIKQDYYFNKGVFLQGNIPSLKNSKEIQIFKKWIPDPNTPGSKILKQFNRLAPSKTVETYLKNFEYVYMQNKVDIMNLFGKDKIWHVGLYFVRDSKRKFDFNNASQIIQDLFVKYGYLEDDNMDFLRPYPLGYHVNPDKPGVLICNVKDVMPLKALLCHFEGIIEKCDTDMSPVIDHSLYAIKIINEILYEQ